MSPWELIYNLSNVTRLLGRALEGSVPEWLAFLVLSVVGLLGLFAFLVPSQLATIWIERRLIARLQVRRGPNRWGPWGILQPIADALKILTKEAIMPTDSDKWVFLLAPIVVFIPAMLLYAVLPFGPGMVFADLNIGVLYLVAVASPSVITVFMAGWSSHNKYSLLGAMRAVAQMVSYEIPMVLALVGVVLVAGTMQMSQIVERQIEMGTWFVLLQPLGFLIYFIAAMAELNRTPMDIMEAESELTAGYHTEYSGMRFSLFYVAEYTSALAVCAITTTLFFGGWASAPLLDFLPPWLWFIAKVYFFFCVMVWIRGTLPRLRIDQLMDFAWKFLIPLSLLNIFLTGLEALFLPQVRFEPGFFLAGLVIVNVILAGLLLAGWSKLLERRAAVA